MIKQWLCVLGLHDWETTVVDVTPEDDWFYKWVPVRRECQRCGIRQFNRRIDGKPKWEDQAI